MTDARITQKSEHTILEIRDTLDPDSSWVYCSCGEVYNYHGSYDCNRWMETHGR